MRSDTDRAVHSVRLSWGARDRHTHLVPLLALGAGALIFLAVVGLPPIWPHNPLHRLGVMAPTTGGTRAVVALLHGRVELAWAYNPAAFFVLAGWLALGVRYALGRLTGRWLNAHGRVGWPLLAIAALLVAVLWANQQLNAELLMEGRDAFAERLSR